MRKGPLENSVETHLVDRVEKELSGMALKGDVPGRRFLDRILILPRGVTVYCECKRPQGGRYSRHQLETAERLVKLGHEVAFIVNKQAVDWFVNHVRIAAYYSWVREEASGVEGLYLLSRHNSIDVWSLPHE